MRVLNTLPVPLDVCLVDHMGAASARVSVIKECCIVDFRTEGKTMFSSGHTIYVLDVIPTVGPAIPVEKRYSDFDDFHLTIYKQLQELEGSTGEKIAPPPKSFFSASASEVRDRAEGLKSYLNSVIRAGQTNPSLARAARAFLIEDESSDVDVPREDFANATVIKSGMVLDMALEGLATLNTTVDMRLSCRLGGARYDSSTACIVIGDKTSEGVVMTDVGHSQTLTLRVEITTDEAGAKFITIYSDYVIVNTSGLQLTYYPRDQSSTFGLITKDGGLFLPEAEDPTAVASWMFKPGVQETIFAFPNKDKKLIIKQFIASGQWAACEPFEIDAVGSNTMVECWQRPNKSRAFQIGVSIVTRPGNYLTKQVRLWPRFIVCNHIDDLEMAVATNPDRTQQDALQAGGGSQAVHLSPVGNRSMALCVVGVSGWSEAFAVDSLRDFPLLVRDKANRPLLIVRVQVRDRMD